jgi:uncharacterized Fe-S cluster protein YjdI
MFVNNNREYTNGEIKVFWKPSLCIHSTICFSELPDVFKPGKRPWVEMNGASTKRIIEVVDRCPTEALTWEKIEKPSTAETENFPGKVIISLIANGPVCIKGNIEISHEDGSITYKEGNVSICRCNRSAKMPFCDGAHNQ